MAADTAKELRSHNVAAVSIWMGVLSTERTNAYLASLPSQERSGFLGPAAGLSSIFEVLGSGPMKGLVIMGLPPGVHDRITITIMSRYHYSK
jgi:hypothetical protein